MHKNDHAFSSSEALTVKLHSSFFYISPYISISSCPASFPILNKTLKNDMLLSASHFVNDIKRKFFYKSLHQQLRNKKRVYAKGIRDFYPVDFKKIVEI